MYQSVRSLMADRRFSSILISQWMRMLIAAWRKMIAPSTKFAPLAHDHRAQHLAAELEAQRERNALRHGEPCMRLIFTKSDNALRAGKQENDRSRSSRRMIPNCTRYFNTLSAQ